MPLNPGTHVGPYEIVSALGAGGMGEVYRAKDHALGREVAIKVLPDAFAGDPDRLARFEREAKSLAALNHPNIAQVFGFEKNPAALVMELLEGRTLRDLLSEGPLPARKAIDYGAQLARGLAAAHDRGLIHRDLKPENIFVLTDGRIKILDFGLARQVDAPVAGATQTMTAFRGTDPGTVMGTVGYMAPEQVRGAALDHRADLFALGAVIYEMIAGQRAFHRDTPAETMTAILREDPPELSSSRANLSPAIDRIVRHCLEKNPIERFQTARDVAFALDSLSGSGSGSGPAVAAAPEARSNRERWTWAVVVAALLAAVGWLALQPGATGEAARPAAMRLTLPLPEGVRLLDMIAASSRLALSPDGSKLAFVGVDATNRRALWIQSLRDPAARAIDDTLTAGGPTWSPDSKWVLFSAINASASLLKKLPVDGGAAITLNDRAGWVAWAPDGTILLEPLRGERELLRLTSDGTAPTPVLPKVVNGGATGNLSFLPDGRHFLHRSMSVGQLSSIGTYIGALDSPERQLLLPGPDFSQAVFANGMLVFARNGALLAQPFDLASLKTTGEPEVLAEGVEQTTLGAGFSVSTNGTLVYEPRAATSGSRLQWFDRKGVAVGTLSDDADYSNLELSPDGRRLLVSVREQGVGSRDIFIIDTVRGLRQRLTFDPSDERSAVWSANGADVIYTSKGLELYQRSSGFTGGEIAVQSDGLSKDPNDVSRDGRFLLYRVTGKSSANDVVIKPLDGSGPARTLLGSVFSENSARFSPDGKSVVYIAEDSGRPEVYVVSLEPGGGKTQLSIDGGSSPRWRRDGQEILYLNAERTMMSVPVKGSGARFDAGSPVPLFQVNHVLSPGATFDVSADGQRFIVNTVVQSKVSPHVVVIVNWPSLLKPTGLRKP